MNGFSGFGNSPAKHDGSPKGLNEDKHNKWHALETEETHDKVWNSKLKKYERISKVTPPKTSEAKKSAERAKTETEEDDIKETERINP